MAGKFKMVTYMQFNTWKTGVYLQKKVSLCGRGFISQSTFSADSLMVFIQPPCAIKIHHILGQPLKMECGCPNGRWIQNSYIYIYAICLLKNRCATSMKRGVQKKKRKKMLDVAVWRWGAGQAGGCTRVLPRVPDHPHWQRLLCHTR